MVEFKKLDASLSGDVVKETVIENRANRYKFTLKHESGLELEVSMDFVNATTKHPSLANADGTPRVARFPQVEIEMDHVQAKSTGPVQGAYTKPTETGLLGDDATQDTFLKGLKEPSMGGAPTTHALEDVRNPKIYQDASYVQMQGATTSLRTALFPEGVLPARQKSAQALEQMGLIAAVATKVEVNFPYDSKNVQRIEVNAQTPNTFRISGALGTGKPTNVQLYVDNFPLSLALDGNETAEQTADKIAKLLNPCVLLKPVVSESAGVFQVALVAR
jgi:hypothetical protein